MTLPNKKTLTCGGFSVPLAIFILISVIATITSAYLALHYYDVRFPSGLKDAASGICNLNSFFNCDSATFSVIADLGGVPIAALGAVLSALFFLSGLFPSLAWEQTNKTLAFINLVGCLALFLFSLIVLKSLCPFCTLYYVCSAAIFFLYYKYSDASFLKIHLGPSLFSIILLGITATSFYQYTSGLKEKQMSISGKIISEFKSLPKLAAPNFESPFYIHADVSNPNSKVKISIFSDFQCPHCKRVADDMHMLARRFKNQIAINYYFFPLDSSCNPQINSAMHPLACKAAFVSACDTEKFASLHDEIFKNQDTLTEDFLVKLAEQNALKKCLDEKTSAAFIEKTIQQGVAYQVESTPTLIINGVKIEGAIPPIHLMALVEELLKN